MLNVDELKKKAVVEFGTMITEVIEFPDGGINVHIVGGFFKQYFSDGRTSEMYFYDGTTFGVYKPKIKERLMRRIVALRTRMKVVQSEG